MKHLSLNSTKNINLVGLIQIVVLSFIIAQLLGCGEKQVPDKVGGQTSVHVQLGYQSLAGLSTTNVDKQYQKTLVDNSILEALGNFFIPAAHAVPLSIAYPYFSLVTLEIVGDGVSSESINRDYNDNRFVLTSQGHIILSDTDFMLDVPDTVAQTFIFRAYNLDDLRIYRGEGSVSIADLQQAQVPLQIAMEVDIDESVPQLASDPGCSGDADGDGICSEFEDLFLNGNGEPDMDNDSIINSLDDDSDGDGVLDIDERDSGANVLGKTSAGGFPFFVNYNQAPAISGIPDIVVQPGTPYSFTPTASDPDGDPVTFNIINQPSWATFDEVTGTLSGTPTAADIGVSTNISISVSDWQIAAALPIFNIQVLSPVNNPPVITILGDNPIDVIEGTVYNDPGATAFDAEDGNVNVTVSNNVDTSVIGTQLVTYDATDSQGLAATQAVRTVNVIFNNPPVINLNGDAIVNVLRGSTYTDVGAVVTDVEDDNATLTAALVTTGANIDTSVTGTHTVTYDVVDNGGKAATQVSRTVVVNDPPGRAYRLISKNQAGNPGNAQSGTYSAISADGRYIVYESLASDLVADDTNGFQDVFLYDVQLDATTLISRNLSGNPANGDSLAPTISADGQFVAYSSLASDLVNGDSNGTYDVFLYDTQNDVTTRISVDSAGVESNDYSFVLGAISANGRYVAFESAATNLVAGDANGQVDVFRHDAQTGETILVSVGPGGIQGNNTSNFVFDMSDDGNLVLFRSDANNLVANDGNNCSDDFIRDINAGITTRVSVGAGGTETSGTPCTSWTSEMSNDGQYIAFESRANNLFADNSTLYDIFLRNTANDTTSHVSVNSSGAPSAGANINPKISGNGRYVTFESDALNTTAEASAVNPSRVPIAYIHDTATAETTMLVQPPSGAISLVSSASAVTSVNTDGSALAFISDDYSLVPNDSNGSWDVFLVSRDTDNDGLGDIDETRIGTQPIIPDTDGDGVNDGDEVRQGSNPVDPGSVPINTAPTITLTGQPIEQVTIGQAYVDQGATANDTEDGDISTSVLSNASVVDTASIGAYTVAYDVWDSGNLRAQQVTRTVYVVPQGSTTKTWFGTTTDWNDDNNWFPVGVPTVADNVYIPANAQQQPVLSTSRGANDLFIEAGASLNTAGFTLMVAGNADVNGVVTGTGTDTDIIRMTGTGVTIHGTFPNLQIDGVVSVSGPTTVTSDVWIYAQGSNLNLNGNTLTVNGQFEIFDTTGANDALLTMTNPADTLIVGDTIRFHGGDTSNTLTDGVIIARGNAFFQNFNPTAFAPSGNHRVVFSGTAQQSVTLFNSAADNTGSHFNIVEIDNPAGVNFNNNTHFNATPTIINGQVTSNASTTSFIADTINDIVGDRWLFTNTYFNGSPATLPPSITSNVRFNANTVLNADLNINGALAIYEQGANLTLNGHTVTVSGDFRTQNTTGTTVDNDATLTMTNPNDVLDIGGEARFLGGDTSGLLTDGVIYLAGYFWQNDNTASYSASGNHRLVLDGAAQQNVRFQNFGAAATASHFQNLEIRNGSTIQLTRNVYVNGELVIGNTVTPLITSSDRVLTTATTNVDGVVFDNVQVNINGATTPVFNNVVFQNYTPTVTQLALNFDNVTTTFNGLTFNTAPTTGRYINGNGSSTLTLTNTSPQYGIPKTNVANGFVINWGTGTEDTDNDGLTDADELNLHGTNPVLADTDGDGIDDGAEIAAGSDPLDPASVPPGSGGNKQWIGGDVNNPVDWSTAANWSPSGVPDGTHDVTIPAAAVNQPQLSSNVTVNNLLVEAGAEIATAGFSITALGNVDGGNTITGTGTVILSGVDVTLQGTLPNILIEGTVSLSGTTSVNGEVRVRNAGRLNLNGNSLTVDGNFLTERVPANDPGIPALVMQNANDQLTATGNVRFWAGDMTGLLTDGVITVAGDLSSGNAGTVFAPSGNHRVVLNGSVQQNVGFVAPGYGASEGHLNILEIQNPVQVHFTGATYISSSITVGDTAGIVTGGDVFLADTVTMNAPTDRWQIVNTRFTGSPASIPSPLTTIIYINGAATLSSNLTITGALYVEGLNANLNLNGNTVTVNGNFETRSTSNGDQDATLTMVNPADLLQVNGNAVFNGGNTNGQLTAGTINVTGNFTQSNNFGNASNSSFSASGAHSVILSGSSQQSVQFANPGVAINLSHFQNVNIQNPVGLGISNVFVNGRTTVGAAMTPVIGFSNTWTTAGVDINGLVIDTTLFNIVGNDVIQFNNVTFQNQLTTVNPLLLNFAGVAATFDGLAFNTLPNTTNYYIVGDGASTVTLTNAIPGYGIPRTSLSNGFVINWGAGTEDTDGDGLTDADEFNIYLTNPVLIDTDSDGISDGDEVTAGSDPLNASSTPLGAPVFVQTFIDFDQSNGEFWTPGTLWQWGTPTASPGPTGGHTGINVWGTNLSGNYTSNATESLYFPPIDLTTATDPTLSFRMWGDTEVNDGLTLEAFNGATWEAITQPVTPDYEGLFNNDPAIPIWNTHHYRDNYIWSAVSLTPYVGQQVKLRLTFRSNSPDNNSGFYIDDIHIDEESSDPDNDGVAGIINEFTTTRTDPYNSDTDNDGYNDSADNAPRNPTNYPGVIPLTIGATGAYVDFENFDGGFVGRGRFIGGNGDLGAGPSWTLGTLWEWGPPTAQLGPPGAFSGNNVWGTNLAGNYYNGARESLMFPPIDLTDSTDPVLTFRIWVAATDFDGVKVQVYDRTTLGFENPTPLFPAYDTQVLNDPTQPGWANQTDGNNGYVLVAVDLAPYVATQQPVVVRLQFNSNSVNNSSGIYIDDVRLNEQATDPDQDGLNGIINEFNTYGTDPFNPDTDGDQVNDGAEIANGTDPLDPLSN